MKKVYLLSLPLAAALLLLGVGTAQSAAFTAVANYKMNEASGAKVLVDSGPNKLNGTIGTSIRLNGDYFSFPKVTRGDGGTVDPQHLATVYSNKLNPDTSSFTVTTRIRLTGAAYGNVMQKGQSGTQSFWKMQLDGSRRGSVTCSFDDTAGNKGAIRSIKLINDGRWHVVSCSRTANKVTVTIDGVSRSINRTLKTITNTNPLTIGGKLNCRQVRRHDCDYFVGDMSYLTIQKG